MAKTFSEWIATLSAVTGLGAGDKVPVVEGGTAKYVEGDDLGGGITALTGDVTASGTGIVVASIATGVIVNADVNASAAIDATKIADGTVSNAEFQYLNGVTSNIQTQINAIRPYAVYVALLSQSGTDAPVATVLENTLGGTVVWTRNDAGDYTGTLAGAFTVNKTTVNVSIASSYFAYVLLSASTVDALSLYSTQADGSGIDDAFDKAFIEIRVYP